MRGRVGGSCVSSHAMPLKPSHPSWRPIFCLSKSHTASPLFTENASLVPCPISYNPLPCSKNPSSAPVLLTCSTKPVMHITSCCLPPTFPHSISSLFIWFVSLLPHLFPSSFAFSSAHPDCLETDCSLCEGAEHA